MFRKFSLLVLVVCLAIAAGPPGGSLVSAQTSAMLRFPLGGEPPTIDPYFATDFSSGDLTFLLYTTLVGLDSQGRIVSDGAKGWDVSPDGLVNTFHLLDKL